MTKGERANVAAYVRLIRRASSGGLSTRDWGRLRHLGALPEVRAAISRSGGTSMVKRTKAVDR